MTVTVASLQEEYAPLTEAEAKVVLSRLAGDREVAEIVAEVKAERAGPAAQWEDTPEVESPVAAEIAAVREALDSVSQKRIADAGNDSDRELNRAGRLMANLDEINAYLTSAAEEEAELSRSAEVDLEDSTAAELVAHLREHPEDADDVEEAENARDTPRKSVLDAVEKARTS